MTSQKHHPLQVAAEKSGLAPDVIIRFVSFEWIVPVDWQAQLLDDEDIARARLIWELQTEFGVNDEAVPIILRLIDQLHCLQTELKKR